MQHTSARTAAPSSDGRPLPGVPDGLPGEVDAHVAVATVRDLPLPDGGVLALVTLDSPDGRRPTTLGPRGLEALRSTLAAVRDRAGAGELAAVAVTGRPGCFVAGADLGVARMLRGEDDARALARLGHATLRLLGEMPVPTVAWVSGYALGGGLELALHCDHRVVASGVRALGLPEAHLGIVPGWGGCWLLPRLVGLETAIDLAVLRPLAGNRLTGADEAARLGLVDAVLPAGDFEAAALAWTVDLLRDGPAPRTDRTLAPGTSTDATADDGSTASAAVTRAATTLESRLHGAAPSYAHVLDLLARAGSRDRDAGFAAEDEALAVLLVSDQSRAAVYATELTGRGSRARTPGTDPAVQPVRVRSVGIVGAGLMAAQLAVLLGGRLDVPVHLREVDAERAAAGRERIRALVDQQVERGRLSAADGEQLVGRLQVGTDLNDLAGADLVIEAVTEVLAVKRAVFADVEALVGPGTVLATNTSALSVTAMADGLAHPERVVGLHFFNPVAQMPLVEVVATGASTPVALATAVDVATRAGKTVVRTTDRPGFVVNRVLLRMLSEVLGAVEDGAPVTVADQALRPLGLPMSPFALLQLVGLPVARHVLGTLHDELGGRFRASPRLDRLVAEGRRVAQAGPGAPGVVEVDPSVQEVFGAGGRPSAEGTAAVPDADGVLARVCEGLAEEIGSLLDEGVVAGPEQVDLAMILGAGWPVHLGGICPYLDRAGWSQRVLGRRLLPPGVADASAPGPT